MADKNGDDVPVPSGGGDSGSESNQNFHHALLNGLQRQAAPAASSVSTQTVNSTMGQPQATNSLYPNPFHGYYHQQQQVQGLPNMNVASALGQSTNFGGFMNPFANAQSQMSSDLLTALQLQHQGASQQSSDQQALLALLQGQMPPPPPDQSTAGLMQLLQAAANPPQQPPNLMDALSQALGPALGRLLNCESLKRPRGRPPKQPQSKTNSSKNLLQQLSSFVQSSMSNSTSGPGSLVSLITGPQSSVGVGVPSAAAASFNSAAWAAASSGMTVPNVGSAPPSSAGPYAPLSNTNFNSLTSGRTVCIVCSAMNCGSMARCGHYICSPCFSVLTRNGPSECPARDCTQLVSRLIVARSL